MDARKGLMRLKQEGIRVQLCCIDPPYRSGRNFGAYDDRTDAQDYYAMMRQVLQGIYEVLDDAGSIFVHIDERTHAHLRLILDELFGEENFRNEIIWAYRSGGRATGHFSRKHDVILYYVKSDKAYFDPMQDAQPRRDVRANHMKKGVDEEGRSYRTITSHGKEYRYYDDDLVPPSDVWDDIEHLQQKDPERTGYPTQKPQRLLERIIKCASREGDVVLDAFAGSGTTLAAARALGRGFVGMDESTQAAQTVKQRLGEMEWIEE